MKIGLVSVCLLAGLAFAEADGSRVCRPTQEHAAALRRHTGIPSLAVSPVNGRLWVTFYGGVTPGEDSNSYVPLMTSADGGKTWKTVCVVEPATGRRVFDPELWVAPDGRLRWSFTSRACTPVARDNLRYYAGDEGDPKTDRLMWGELGAEDEPTELPGLRQVADGVMMCKPTVLGDGTWLLPVAHWRVEPSACFFASTDGGKTFALRGGVSHFPKENRLYDEHSIVELANGDLLTFIRAAKNPPYLESVSHDGGRTWEVGRKARFENTSSRHFLRRLKSGNLLLVKNGPIDKDVGRRAITAFVSEDNGTTWKGGLVLDARENTSYPDGDQAADGTIYVTYDRNRLNEQEILLAAVTEEEILAGKVTRPTSFLRRLVISAPPKVTIGGWLGEKFRTSVNGNFMKLDLEKDFFRPFVARTSSGGFIGLGKNADAAVHYAANTRDPAVIARKDEIIDFIIRNQLPDGYTGYFSPTNRLTALWDIHEMGFIVQGLLSDWELFGNRAALAAAKKNVDYVIDRYKGMKDNWEFDFITDRETTLGFGFGVARLYAATKEERYRDFLRYERSLDTWDQPIFIGRDKMIYGQAYGYTGTCLEQLELHRYDPNPRYLRPALRALDFQVNGDGVLINGNGGVCECWTNDQDGEGYIGETCNATFELLFWDALYRSGVADRALLGDLMERCICNALFGAMSEDGRRLRYYTPLNGDRKFWPDDLYCCPNNFRRGMSRLPEYVFYAEKNAISVNLYTPCEARLNTGRTGVKIVVETDYPRDGHVKFTLSPDRAEFFSFNLRIPHWVKRPSVRINGTEVTYLYKPGEMLHLPKVWKKGDVVEADFPMEVRTVRGRKRQAGRFAVMRGPIVYAVDTHAIDVFKDWHPHDVQTEMMMDPKRLSFADGKITAYVSTVGHAVGVAEVSVDGEMPKNVRKVELLPFASEKANLTYFRAPDLEGDCREEDSLFVRSPSASK